MVGFWGYCGAVEMKPRRGSDYEYEVILMLTATWTPKVCKIMAFRAIVKDLGPSFYILLEFRYNMNT